MKRAIAIILFLTGFQLVFAQVPLSESLNNIPTASSLNGTESYVVVQGGIGKKAATSLVTGVLQPFDSDLSAIAGLTGTNTIYYRSAENTWTPVVIGANLTFTGGTLASTAGGGGTWGSITGTLSNQTDLQAALNAKVSLSSMDTTLEFASLLGMTPTAAMQTIAATTLSQWWSASGGVAYAAENKAASGPVAGVGILLYSNDGAPMAANDRLGTIILGGSSSASTLRNSISISGFASQAWVEGSAHGSRMTFENTLNGAASRAERMAIEGNGLISFGGSTASFPALKRVGTTLQVRLADDSADAPMSASTGTFSGAVSAASFSGSASGLTGFTDAQIPNTITIDLATTATTANAGDSATAFFTTGQIERARGGTGADTSAFGNSLLGSDVSNATVDVDTIGEFSTALAITGSPSASTFLRGDGQWIAPAGGGTVTATGGALTLNAIMLGAGGTDSKVLSSLGTSSTVLHGNASGAPAFGPVSLTSDVSGLLPAANLAEGTPVTGHVPIYQSDGSVDWSAITATSAGSAKWIQYAGASGSFAAEAGFEYDPGTDTFTVSNISTTSLTAATLTVNVPITWADNVRQTFNPGVTTPGFNWGSYPGDPSGAANGDCWYDSTNHLYRGRANGTNFTFGAGGGPTAWSSIGNAAGNASISLAGFTSAWTSTLDSAGAFVWDILNTDADSAAATGFIQLRHNDGADADVVYAKFVGDADGTPVNDYVMSQTSFAIGSGITMTLGGVQVSTLTSSASTMTLTATGFNGNLTTADDTVQEVAQKLDDLTGALPMGYLSGLTMSNNGVDAVNDLDIAVGVARDATNAQDMTLVSGLTKRLDATWVVGTGQGGLDTGAVANGTYHVWAIKRNDTGVVDILFSTSPTAPTMPANYTFKRRIGSILRVAGTIIPFTQDGNTFQLKSPVLDVNVTNLGTTSTNYPLSVPTGIKVSTEIVATVSRTSAFPLIYVRDPDLTDLAPSSTATPLMHPYSSASGAAGSGRFLVKTNTSGEIAARADAAATVFKVATCGWIDTRDINASTGGISFTRTGVQPIACSDMTTAITATGDKAYWKPPFAITVTDVVVSAFTAPTGAAIIVDIEEGGTSILGANRLQIDATETSSRSAVNQPTISDSSIASDALVTIDFDQVGSTIAGAGIIVQILYTY